MDKSVVKMIALIVSLLVIVAVSVLVMIKGVNIGAISAISINGISDKKLDVEKAKADLDKVKVNYEQTKDTLETAKSQFNDEKNEYELISDETIKTVKEATKEEEYLIEYLWITLGNYASAHKLTLSVIEPGGKISQPESTTTDNSTEVSTGTGIKGNESGVTQTTNAATTGLPTDGVETSETTTVENVQNPITADGSALTVQVKGNYIDLADFVFEVENDKSLRFRLDNIKMASAGGNAVTATFNVKDFTVLKYLD